MTNGINKTMNQILSFDLIITSLWWSGIQFINIFRGRFKFNEDYFSCGSIPGSPNAVNFCTCYGNKAVMPMKHLVATIVSEFEFKRKMNFLQKLHCKSIYGIGIYLQNITPKYEYNVCRCAFISLTLFKSIYIYFKQFWTMLFKTSVTVNSVSQ